MTSFDRLNDRPEQRPWFARAVRIGDEEADPVEESTEGDAEAPIVEAKKTA